MQTILNWLNTFSLSDRVHAQSVENTSELLATDKSENILNIQGNLNDFLFWGFSSITIISIVLLVSIIRRFEELFDPILHRVKKFAPFVMQGTLGIALLLSAFHDSLFEAGISLDIIFDNYANLIQVILAVGGGMLLAGILPQLVGLVVIIIFIPLIGDLGFYSINYATHLGEAITIFLFGGTYQIMRSNFSSIPRFYRSMELHLHKYKFLILRISFGISLIFTAIYTNYLNGVIALEILTTSNIINFISFDPTFLIIGALVIEILLGIFFIIGFEIRFTAIIYIIFLIGSIIFFQEAIWSHVILIGTCIAMFTHGYDRFTIGGKIFSRGNLEPIL